MTRKDARVYRSRHQIAIFSGIGLVGAGIAIGMLFEAGRTAVVLLLIGFLIVWIPCNARLAFSGVFADPRGVRVSNLLSSFELSWSEIDEFEIKRWGLFPYVCVIRLRNGETKHALGIQERTNFPDGSGEEMVRELNREVSRNRGAASSDIPSSQDEELRGVGGLSVMEDDVR